MGTMEHKVFIPGIMLMFLFVPGFTQNNTTMTTAVTDSDGSPNQSDETELEDTVMNLVIGIGVIGFILVLLFALFIWFCCSTRNRLHQQKALIRVNESDIGILREYIEKLTGRLDIARIGRIPTTIYREDDTTLKKVLRSLPKRVSTVIDPNIEEVTIGIQDDDQVLTATPSPTISPQIQVLPGPPATRPETITLDNIIEEGASAVPKQGGPPGIFRGQPIGSSGGIISFRGLKLNIPPGALDEDVLIMIGIVWGDQVIPKMEKDAALLSPIVCCEPSGLRFKTKVTLTIPHCAVDVTKRGWKIEMRTSEVPVNSFTENTQLEWKNMVIDDYDEITETTVVVNITHFSWYSIIGYLLGTEPAEKLVQVVAFSSFDKEENALEPVVYCANHYEMAEKEERKKNRDFQKMKFQKDGGNMSVGLNTIPSGWKLFGQAKEELDYNAIWQTGWDRCKFVLEQIPQTSNTDSSVYLEMTCQQKKSNTSESKTLKMKQNVAQEMKLQNSLFPSDFRKFLREVLDVEDRIDQRNWVGLAEKGLGLTFGEIRYIRDLKESAGKSPTERLLDQWAEKGKTLKQFEMLMKEMGVRRVVLKMKTLNADTSSNPGTPGGSPRIRGSPGQHRGIVATEKRASKA